MLVTLCGGVGAARLLAGLVRVAPADTITAVVNVGDDMVLHGLHISPDLDTITYTLAGMDNQDTGWGISGESWTVMDELERLGGVWAIATWPRICSARNASARETPSPRSRPPSRRGATSTCTCCR